MVKRINLSMADELFAALENKRKTQGYMTTQELINDILRRSLLVVAEPKKKSKAGRPPKEEDTIIKYFTK
jgi:metal-responsive CopG/Arc/MetJ family transcriptional regulator